MSDTPKVTYLKDYKKPEYLIDKTMLSIEPEEVGTRVFASLQMRRAPGVSADVPLVLVGDSLRLDAISVDDRLLKPEEYEATPHQLTVHRVPEKFTLTTAVAIYPEKNTQLMGLYQSRGILCTQCEAEGFRRITYYLDRPDVMAPFTVMIEADPKKYPVLLSNGNCTDKGPTEDNLKHYAVWYDPFKKPSYLFAMVAGNLDCLEDQFTTQSGRVVELKIYVEPGRAGQAEHAMDSLKKAMRWDEVTFGREYDLNIYMIVAIDDFNMGAMENKGLNIFNSKYILADAATATDEDFLAIESVIGHEYFHNWTGNRITCRDWFQLSLKEGLTIFRDQEFSSDTNSRAVKRIDDVRYLRAEQFPQDAGPMAHSIRPTSYIEMNNFYTTTVYHKGAEVIRMMQTLVGKERFRKGMDLYFERHDGQAVTTEDFAQAISDGAGIDLTQFRLWYEQAGTPELHVTRAYDAGSQQYKLTIKQTCPLVKGETEKKPFHMPVTVALFNRQGQPIPLVFANEKVKSGQLESVLELRQAEQTFVFKNVESEPVPSLLRGFSAPVKLHMDYTDEELLLLLNHDTDFFNRWEAGQNYALRYLLKLVNASQNQHTLEIPEQLVQTFSNVIQNKDLDLSYLALLLSLPSESAIGDAMDCIDPDAIYSARSFMQQVLGERLNDILLQRYSALHDPLSTNIDAKSIGRRSLKNRCLHYLMQQKDNEEAITLCELQTQQSQTMTDNIHALQLLAMTECPAREKALHDFYKTWKQEPLVLNKWFAVQARSRLPGAVQRVRELMKHPDFSMTNPNCVRALIGVFTRENSTHFHQLDGSGYTLLTEVVEAINPLNPQLAARLLEPFTHWRRYNQARQNLIRQQLDHLLALPKLSKDVFEIVSRSVEF